MIDPIPVVMLVVLLALPLAARRRGLHAMLAMAALAWIVASALGTLAPGTLDSLFFPNGNRALHDTYYVVSHLHYQLSIVVLLGLFALGAWLARPLSRLATIAFWVMHLAIALTFLPQQLVGTMGPSADTFALAQRLETINRFSSVASAIAFAATLFLALLIALGLIRRFRGRA